MATANQNEWIARVLGLSLEAPAGTADAADSAADTAKARLDAIAADFKRLPGAAALLPDLRAAIVLARDGDPEADAAIEALEDALAELSRSARIAAMTAELAAARPSKAGFVAVAKARLQWAEVEGSVEVAANNVVDGAYALLATPPYCDDPRASDPQAAALIEGLRHRLPPLGEVTAAVNAALDDAGPGRKAAIAAALTTIDSFLPRLQADPNLLKLETEAGSFPSVSLIATSLHALRDALGGIETDAEALRSAA